MCLLYFHILFSGWWCRSWRHNLVVSIDHESYQNDIRGFYYNSCFQSCHKGVSHYHTLHATPWLTVLSISSWNHNPIAIPTLLHCICCMLWKQKPLGHIIMLMMMNGNPNAVWLSVSVKKALVPSAVFWVQHSASQLFSIIVASSSWSPACGHCL